MAESEESVRLGREHLRRRDHGRAEELLRIGLALWQGKAFEELTGSVSYA
ncbi:hypothetical protein OG851_38960 [Streptomyces sp. NBC_00161]